MKKVYFVQANAVYGDEKKNTYIPYAAGCLVAYAWADERIAENYEFGRFIYTREDPDKVTASLEEPFMVAFSCSVWNMNYNKTLAEKVKKAFPKCIIIFGGHHVSADEKTLEECPYADILIHNGGEEAFLGILLALENGNDLCGIDNISFCKNGEYINTGYSVPKTPDYPSPYLEGWFDEILKDDIEFSVILETNRGCPNRCAFCDWGALKTGVRLFDLNKIFAELEWVAKNKIEYVYCADANFGLFDRDVEITEKFVELKNKFGYPQKLKVNFTKNRFEIVGKISKLLSDNNIGKSQTLSFQSLDPNVLECIGRRNLSLEYFSSLMELYSKSGIPTYSELILALPLETKESFIKGVCALLEAGQHKSINIYPCELLPNSQMGSKDFAEKYSIKAVQMPFDQYHCKPDTKNDIDEFSNMIVSTSTMNGEQWAQSYLFAVCVQAFHCLGLTRFAALYYRNENNVSYEEFYSKLIEKAFENKNGTIGKVLSEIYSVLMGAMQCKNSLAIIDKRFGEITYEPDEMLFLKSVYELDEFMNELREICLSLADAPEDLFRFQKSVIALPNVKTVEKEFGYDFVSYFNDIMTGEAPTLKKKPTRLFIADTRATGDWQAYARETVWYGRRNEATLYTSKIY